MSRLQEVVPKNFIKHGRQNFQKYMRSVSLKGKLMHNRNFISYKLDKEQHMKKNNVSKFQQLYEEL